ncbi:MAG: hypothetical protein J5695_03995, partial [Bacteroidales bacterium]|nr:hypothetical protein [Bacteroidales bacterium]
MKTFEQINSMVRTRGKAFDNERKRKGAKYYIFAPVKLSTNGTQATDRTPLPVCNSLRLLLQRKSA